MIKHTVCTADVYKYKHDDTDTHCVTVQTEVHKILHDSSQKL